MKRAVLWLPALLLALVLTACGGSSEPSWQELVDLGQKYLIELDYEQAIQTFTQAIALEPQRGEAYVGRGDAYAALAANTDPTGNYQNARADYEAGALYLDPSWELVEKLADIYTAQGDAGALQALLQQAAGDLGGGEELDALLGKYGYVQDANGTVQMRVQGYELLAEMTRWSVTFYERENPRPLSYYEQKLRPAVAQLQSLIASEPENAAAYGIALSNVYYMLGEMDNVLETRRWLYELTGAELYSPEGCTITTADEGTPLEGDTYIEQFNGYGQMIAQTNLNSGSIVSVEFNERGQEIFSKVELASGESLETESIYDAEGRISKRIDTSYPDGIVLISEYSYDGDQVHLTIQQTDEMTGALDAYNVVTYAG